MKRNLPLLALFTVVAIVVVCYLGYSSIKKEQVPPTIGDVKIPPAKIVGDDASSGKQQQSGADEKKITSKTIEKTNIPVVNPKAGELIVQGEIKAVDVDKRILTIDQQMDDNSVKISPNVPVDQNAIIRTREKIISLSQINSGDSVGVIVNKDGQARAVLVNY